MYPPAAPPQRTPGPVVTLRVLAWIQVGFGAIGVAIGAAFAVALSTATDSTDDFTREFAQLGLVAALILVVVGIVVLAAIAVPTFLLRTGRRPPRTGALYTLAVVEIFFAVLQLAGTAVGFTDGVRTVGSVLPLLLAAVPTTIAVLALLPASRAWAAGAQPVGPGGPPGPYSGPPGPYSGPPGPYGGPSGPYGGPPPPAW